MEVLYNNLQTNFVKNYTISNINYEQNFNTKYNNKLTQYYYNININEFINTCLDNKKIKKNKDINIDKNYRDIIVENQKDNTDNISEKITTHKIGNIIPKENFKIELQPIIEDKNYIILFENKFYYIHNEFKNNQYVIINFNEQLSLEYIDIEDLNQISEIVKDKYMIHNYKSLSKLKITDVVIVIQQFNLPFKKDNGKKKLKLELVNDIFNLYNTMFNKIGIEYT